MNCFLRHLCWKTHHIVRISIHTGQEREQHPAGEDVKSTSSVAPCGGGEHDGGQHKGDEHHQPGTETAPSHGGDTTSDCGEHGGGGPIYQSILKPTASTPTEEQGQVRCAIQP